MCVSSRFSSFLLKTFQQVDCAIGLLRWTGGPTPRVDSHLSVPGTASLIDHDPEQNEIGTKQIIRWINDCTEIVGAKILKYTWEAAFTGLSCTSVNREVLQIVMIRFHSNCELNKGIICLKETGWWAKTLLKCYICTELSIDLISSSQSSWLLCCHGLLGIFLCILCRRLVPVPWPRASEWSTGLLINSLTFQTPTFFKAIAFLTSQRRISQVGWIHHTA